MNRDVVSRTAITGTPCTGKTTLAELLRSQGHTVVDLKQWASEQHAVVGHDDADNADIIDMEALATAAERLPTSCFIEGHLAHLLPLEAIWVIRCDPATLRPRLQKRGYAETKVLENLEAEALDIILQEALAASEQSGARVIQRDASTRSPEALLSAFTESSIEAPKAHDLEPVDWSHRLPFA